MFRRNFLYLSWWTKIMLLMDRYSCDVTAKTLLHLHDNVIIVNGLVAHKLHLLQPLDVVIFGTPKEEFREMLNRRTVTSQNGTRNDIFAIWELFCIAYHKCIIAENVIGGFERSVLQNAKKSCPNPEKLRAQDFTSSGGRPECVQSLHSTLRVASIMECHNERQKRFEMHLELCQLLKRRKHDLLSDGVAVENGIVALSSTTGATFRS